LKIHELIFIYCIYYGLSGICENLIADANLHLFGRKNKMLLMFIVFKRDENSFLLSCLKKNIWHK